MQQFIIFKFIKIKSLKASYKYDLITTIENKDRYKSQKNFVKPFSFYELKTMNGGEVTKRLEFCDCGVFE